MQTDPRIARVAPVQNLEIVRVRLECRNLLEVIGGSCSKALNGVAVKCAAIDKRLLCSETHAINPEVHSSLPYIHRFEPCAFIGQPRAKDRQQRVNGT